MKRKGFTLIEMLLVVALIATITAVVIPNIVSSVNEGKTRECESYLTLLENNLEMYKTDFNIDANETVEFSDLKSRVSEINVGDSVVNELKIIKKSNGRFSYCAKITCNGKSYQSKSC